jgi:molecular chaperone HtpG
MTHPPQSEERHFEAEAAQILELMTHSVYSNRETFLRELISNASDAIDRRRFAALSNDDVVDPGDEYHIFLKVDRDERTLTLIDNGIGMNRQEVVENIGTIARSGTKEFLQALQATKKDDLAKPDLIGQFGVGFYSAFMVADRVVLDTLQVGTGQAPTRWESTGDGKYTITTGERREPGTTIVLHLKPVDEEAGLRDYTSEHVLRDVVKRYSDFVAFPIKMNVERQEPERDADGKVVEGGKTQTIVETATVNSMQAIWTRPPSEVKDEEYEEFYRHISHDWQPPLKRVVVKAEGASEYRSVLFIPKKAPWDLHHQGAHHGLRLYVRRVLIMEACKDLLPEFLRFVRGVVDAEDLPLNVSREMLQEDRHIKVIRKHLVKKVLEALKSLKRDQRSDYESLWSEFGRAVKEGIFREPTQRDALLDVILCHSTHGEALTTLEDYKGRMREDQKAIYYMTGPSLTAVKSSPHLEAFRDKGYEVLLFVDPVDEVWLQTGARYADCELKSVGKGEVELGAEDERKQTEEALEDKKSTHKTLLTRLRSELQDDVQDVRLSTRMTSSAACLVGESGDLSPQLAEMLQNMGQPVPQPKRILELNPTHPLLERLQGLFDGDPKNELIGRYAKLLYGQAVLAEGGQLPEPGEFSKLVADLMADALPSC